MMNRYHGPDYEPIDGFRGAGHNKDHYPLDLGGSGNPPARKNYEIDGGEGGGRGMNAYHYTKPEEKPEEKKTFPWGIIGTCVGGAAILLSAIMAPITINQGIKYRKLHESFDSVRVADSLKISYLQKDIDNLHSQLNGVEIRTEYNDSCILNQVSSLDNKVGGLNGRVSDLEGEVSRVDSVGNVLAQAEKDFVSCKEFDAERARVDGAVLGFKNEIDSIYRASKLYTDLMFNKDDSVYAEAFDAVFANFRSWQKYHEDFAHEQNAGYKPITVTPKGTVKGYFNKHPELEKGLRDFSISHLRNGEEISTSDPYIRGMAARVFREVLGNAWANFPRVGQNEVADKDWLNGLDK